MPLDPEYTFGLNLLLTERIWPRQAALVMCGVGFAHSDADPGLAMYEATETIPGEGSEAHWRALKARTMARAAQIAAQQGFGDGF